MDRHESEPESYTPVTLRVLRQPSENDPGAIVMALAFRRPVPPHVLRVVETGTLLYVVRPGHEEEDRAALDADFASQEEPILYQMRLPDGTMGTRFEPLPGLPLCEVVAVAGGRDRWRAAKRNEQKGGRP